MYEQHVTRGQWEEATAHLSAVEDAPHTESEVGVDSSVPSDAGSAYVDGAEEEMSSPTTVPRSGPIARAATGRMSVVISTARTSTRQTSTRQTSALSPKIPRPCRS